MAIEIVDLPINSMVIFRSYVNVYQRVCFFIIKPVLKSTHEHPEAVAASRRSLKDHQGH